MDIEKIFLSPIPVPELIDRIAEQVVNRLRATEQPKPDDLPEYLTGNEVEALLKISRTTRYKYTKEGILTQKKIGGKVLFKRNEVLKALNYSQIKKKARW